MFSAACRGQFKPQRLMIKRVAHRPIDIHIAEREFFALVSKIEGEFQ
jgi:hypothetical protein